MGGDEVIDLTCREVKQLFDSAVAGVELYRPPPDNDDQTLPKTGITAWQFPEWVYSRRTSTRQQLRCGACANVVHRPKDADQASLVDDSRKKR